jgi:hypothetical protein
MSLASERAARSVLYGESVFSALPILASVNSMTLVMGRTEAMLVRVLPCFAALTSSAVASPVLVLP